MQTKEKFVTTNNRILTILNLLITKPVSTNEISVELGEISKDCIRADILTLENAGFEIEKIGSKYFSNWKPIIIKLTKKEFTALNDFKNIAVELCDWKFTLNLYKIFEKFTKYMKNEEYANTLMNFGYYSNVDFKLLRELDYHCEKQNEIVFSYLTPKTNKKIDCTFRCKEIKYDKNTNKLHLYGQFKKYKYITYLRIDKILYIKNVKIKSNLEYIEPKIRFYKLKREYLRDFIIEENEEIKEIQDNYVLVEAKVENDFKFMQRIMVLGENIDEVDDDIRQMLFENLSKMKQILNEEKN